MNRHQSLGVRQHRQSDADRQTGSLVGVVVVLVLLVCSLFLVRELEWFARVEDCALAGSVICQASLPLGP